MTGPASPGPPGGPLLVVVGTDYHRFDSLMDWVEQWLAARAAAGAAVPALVQHGTSRAPAGARTRDYLGHAELQEAMAAAGATVVHGGPATIMEARRHGHLPIVVARDPARDEHVDGHQQRFAARLAAEGLVVWCRSSAELAAALDAWVADPARYRLADAADVADDGSGPPGAVRRVGAIVESLIADRACRPGARHRLSAGWRAVTARRAARSTGRSHERETP